jgi:adenine/guanine phosphoribosyltransferase-like PRPP-binding protein
MDTVYPKSHENPLEFFGRCNGYYECRKDSDGTRLTPLVGYAGKYDGEHQWVGEVYANFAKAERHGPVLQTVANQILNIPRMRGLSALINKSKGFCGAPEGGKALANTLATWSGKQYIFPEKQVIQVKSSTSREISQLLFDRHEPEAGELWWIVEDVCNNFSTTGEMVHLIETYRAEVAGIICFLNRSLEYDESWGSLPIISLVRKPIPQYRQDDPFVKADIDAGNVVWKPKIEWDRLMQVTAPNR